MLFQLKRSSFESMVRAHSGDLYRFAYWLTRERARAEDLVQETYARAWANWQSLRDEKAAKGWLMTILHHEHARSFERKRIEIDDEALDEMMYGVESTAYAQLEMREALWKLPEAYREPLLLQVLGGFSGAEIAAMLALTEATVMQRLSRARKALRKLIEPDASNKEHFK